MPSCSPRRPLAAALLLFAAAGCAEVGPLDPPPTASYDLLYESAVTGAHRLQLLRLSADEPLALAPTLVVRDPAPSPGGLWIAFVVENVPAFEVDVWMVRCDGTGLRQLTSHWQVDDQPAWSPDGTRLAFTSHRDGDESDIWVMNTDGSQPRNLTPDPLPGTWEEFRPAWSPDGQRIAFASNRGGDVDIWTMRADGTDFRRITSTEDFDTEPAWSPDGQSIVFRRSNPVQGSDLMIVPAEGGAVRRLSLPGEQRQPAWSPDGALIAYVQQPAPNQGQPEIHTVRPDGTGARLRTVDPSWGGGLNPSWIRR